MLYLLPQAILESADRTPDQVALRFNKQSLTYAQLADKARRLARTLQEQGISRGDRVGIFANKGFSSIIGLYGIMLAGGAYVPLDPFAPTSRLEFVIQDCKIQGLISGSEKLPQVEIMAKNADLKFAVGLDPSPDLELDAIPWDEAFNSPQYPLPLYGQTEFDLAYILYTSGSTGDPKGIMHSHRSGLSFALWAADTYGIRTEDRLSSHAPLHFDLSTFDYFAAALSGATTVIIPEALTKFPANISRLIQDESISIWYSVPFALIQLLLRGSLEKYDLNSLRWILFAGEPFPTKHLRDLMNAIPNASYSNLYGPTETNVCTYYHVPKLDPSSDEPIPIGIPCENIEAMIVDSNNQPTPIGDVGELLIRGGVVMKGYWGRPDLSENCFFYRPVFEYQQDTFYRTGDLVQELPDGNIKYHGRKDRQIKTRGYRVELDEIEIALLSHKDVQEAAVYPVTDGHGSNLIQAAVIPKDQATLYEETLIDHLSNHLPPYAIPVKINLRDDFPRTSTGKINRRALQADIG